MSSKTTVKELSFMVRETKKMERRKRQEEK